MWPNLRQCLDIRLAMLKLTIKTKNTTGDIAVKPPKYKVSVFPIYPAYLA